MYEDVTDDRTLQRTMMQTVENSVVVLYLYAVKFGNKMNAYKENH